MSKVKGFLIVGVITVLVLASFGQMSYAADYPSKPLDFVAPAGAGGGWDLTIRTVAKVLKDTKLVKVPMPVRNNPGAGGAVNLAGLQEKKGSDSIITVYSPPLLLINLNGTTELSYKNVTPLARLIADYAAFVVAADSPFQTMNDVMDALKENIKSVKIGGTSAAGSMDHIQFLIMAQAAGIEKLKEIDYISFQDDSGTAQVLGGHITLFSTGLAEVRALVESGDLRVLAQSADHRVGTGMLAEIPTCIEQGINQTFINWRGLFGAPDMPEAAVVFWRETLQKMSETPEWQEVCKTNGWDSVFLAGDDFVAYLEKVNEEYKAILDGIGMLKVQ